MQVQPYLLFDGAAVFRIGPGRPSANAARQDLFFNSLRHVADRFGVSWMVFVGA